MISLPEAMPAQSILAQAPTQQANSLRQLTASPDSEHERVREAFTQFVGETFYSQMLKAMRSAVGKPAYFHGGRAEEVFTSQLDQTLAEQLADKSTESFVDPMFRRQFPHLAEQVADTDAGTGSSPLGSLQSLRRW